MSEFLQDVKEEKTRIFYIKRAQHVFKKLGEALDNYKYFVSHLILLLIFLNTILGFGPKITPPPTHNGERIDPARARPVPF